MKKFKINQYDKYFSRPIESMSIINCRTKIMKIEIWTFCKVWLYSELRDWKGSSTAKIIKEVVIIKSIKSWKRSLPLNSFNFVRNFWKHSICWFGFLFLFLKNKFSRIFWVPLNIFSFKLMKKAVNFETDLFWFPFIILNSIFII